MMLTTRVQPKADATSRRTKAVGRSVALKVVAFKNSDEEVQQRQAATAKVTFQIPMHVEWGQEVALVGAADTLGNWDVQKSIPMCWNDGDVWTAQAEVPIDTPIQYKYIIQAGQGEVKAVVQWQPCNNLEVQAAAEQAELTIRDAWGGQLHEVLPGTLPLDVPTAPDAEPAPVTPEMFTAEAAATTPMDAAAAAAPAVMPELAAVEFTVDVPEVAVEVTPVPQTPTPTPVATAESAAAPTPAAPETRKPESAAAAMAAAAAPVVRSSSGRRSTTSRAANGSKPSGGNSSRSKVVAAVTTEAPEKQADMRAPVVQYGSLTTAELKEVCKERGLSAKGQRKDLLARLQQFLQQQGRNNKA